MSYQPIENYGVIGDLTTTALVSMAASSIDFMCFPRFDSPTIFAALLDQKKAAIFKSLRRRESSKITNDIFPDTNILLTCVFLAKAASRRFPISWR